MNPDMVLGSILGPDVAMALGGSVGHAQISITLAAEWPLDTNMNPGGGPDPGHPFNLQ